MLSKYGRSSGVLQSAQHSQGLIRDLIRSCSEPLSPNPWSRPLQPGRPVKNKSYKWKTRAVKWRQLHVFNISSHKKNPTPFSFFSDTGRIRVFAFWKLDECIFRFPRSFTVWGCLFPHLAGVWFHFGKGQCCSFFFSYIILIFTKVPQG